MAEEKLLEWKEYPANTPDINEEVVIFYEKPAVDENTPAEQHYKLAYVGRVYNDNATNFFTTLWFFTDHITAEKAIPMEYVTKWAVPVPGWGEQVKPLVD